MSSICAARWNANSARASVHEAVESIMTVPSETHAAFVVIAEFRVKPECLAEFLDAARDDSICSVRDEVGCRQFDIIVPDTQSGNVVFYEVYDSRAGFDLHLETPHLERFRKAFPALIIEELPVRFARRHHP